MDVEVVTTTGTKMDPTTSYVGDYSKDSVVTCITSTGREPTKKKFKKKNKLSLCESTVNDKCNDISLAVQDRLKITDSENVTATELTTPTTIITTTTTTTTTSIISEQLNHVNCANKTTCSTCIKNDDTTAAINKLCNGTLSKQCVEQIDLNVESVVECEHSNNLNTTNQDIDSKIEFKDSEQKPEDEEAPVLNNNNNNSNDNVTISYKVYENELQMPDIMRLIQKDLSEPYSIYTYRYFIHNWPKLCFLAMHGDKCVGAIVCKLDMHREVIKRGYIAMLAVDKEYRKLKIGTNLVQNAIQAMLVYNADEVVLETEITNIPALKLYENLGFVRDKRLFGYYLNGVDALRLKLWFR